MEMENIFNKLNSKDYNNQLEVILENKNFSENIKNLLLSMLYKVEAGYKDYVEVKQLVESKKAYIEEILTIIKDKCNEILVVEKGSPDSLEMEKMNTNFIVDKLEGTIKLMYPNERLLLYTLYKLDDKQVYLDEKYNLIRNAISELLNSGENMNNIEVLRDFNGWNWNIEVQEIPEITTNLIYQNLIFLLGIDALKEWIHSKQTKDFIPIIEENLKKQYGEENAKEILYKIYKISILICTSKNVNEKRRLLEEEQILKSEMEKLEDKKTLLNEVSQIKKNSLKEIKKIDQILNDKKLLEEEYTKRNEKRSEYNKIFSLSHLIDILNKERKKLLALIEEKNRLLEPKYYVETKQNKEQQLLLLENIDASENIKSEKIHEYLISLQKTFIKCFLVKVNNATEKEQILNLIYLLRYYEQIFIEKQTQIKNEKELLLYIENVEKTLIEKANALKVFAQIAKEKNMSYEIIKNIFKTKIISISNMAIELTELDGELRINLYDSNVFEKTIKIENLTKEDVLIKPNKKIKIINI